jgi:Zn-dependent protease with chaperone function
MITAAYFDGRTSRRHPVTLNVDADGVTVTSSDVDRHAPWSDVRLSERTRHGPRLIEFTDGARCEILDTAGFQTLLRQHGHRDSVVVRAQQSWRGVIIGTVACLAVVAAAYAWGLPWLADRVSRHVPEAVTADLSRRTLESLEKVTLPTAVPAERRDRIANRLRQMWPADEPESLRLIFRKGGRLGANALALPSGDILVTDELVTLADGDDDKVIAVLAHELGHVHYRHGLRMVLQSTVVGTLAAAYLGDVSSVVAGVTAAGLQLNYSRGFELEADRYAAQMLTRWGMSPGLLATMLERLDADRQRRSISAQKPAEASAKAGPKPAPGRDYFSSHPNTAERIRRLRGE